MEDPGDAPPVVKEKWRKRTAKFVTAAFYKEKDAFKRKMAKETAEANPTLDPSLFNRPKDYKGKGPAN